MQRYFGQYSPAVQAIAGDQVANLMWRIQNGALPNANQTQVWAGLTVHCGCCTCLAPLSMMHTNAGLLHSAFFVSRTQCLCLWAAVGCKGKLLDDGWQCPLLSRLAALPPTGQRPTTNSALPATAFVSPLVCSPRWRCC